MSEKHPGSIQVTRHWSKELPSYMWAERDFVYGYWGDTPQETMERYKENEVYRTVMNLIYEGTKHDKESMKEFAEWGTNECRQRKIGARIDEVDEEL